MTVRSAIATRRAIKINARQAALSNNWAKMFAAHVFTFSKHTWNVRPTICRIIRRKMPFVKWCLNYRRRVGTKKGLKISRAIRALLALRHAVCVSLFRGSWRLKLITTDAGTEENLSTTPSDRKVAAGVHMKGPNAGVFMWHTRLLCI